MNKIITSVIMILCHALLCSAQNYQTSYNIKRIYSYDGLCGNKVIDICQDAFGRMWFGTTDGVSRYDGSEFVNFTKDNKRHFHISHNYAQTLLALDNGDVWIGTPDSLNIYSYEYDKIICPTAEDGLIYTDITSLCIGKKNTGIWLGTFGNGIVRYDMETQKYDCYNYSDICPSKHITALLEDSNEYLWIGTRYDGLFKLDLRNKVCKKVIPDNKDYIRTIFQDRSGNIWIGTDYGLFYAKGDIIEHIDNPLVNGHSIMKITEDHNGKIWVGGSNVCINFMANEILKNPTSAIIEEINEGPLKNQISYKSIHAIFCDKTGDVWAGSYGGGINIIKKPHSGISQIFPSFEQNGINGSINKTMAIESDSSGNLWFGMDGYGLIHYDMNTQEKKHFKINGEKKDDDYILDILIDKKGNIWTGSYNNGLSVIDGNFSIHHFPTDLTGVTIRTIFESSDGNILFCSEKGLLKRGKNGAITHTDLKYDIRAICEDSHGIFWMATYGNGVVKYDPFNKTITEFNHGYGLNSNIVFDLEIVDNVIWCATDYGINAISMNGRLIQLPQNLRNINTTAITSDNEMNIWAVGTNVIKIEHGTYKITQFSSEEINELGDFSEGASYSAPDGKVYFGGFNGVIGICTSENFAKNDIASPIMFTGLKIFDQTVNPSDNYMESNPLSKNINIQKTIELKPWQNVFTIEFASPEYNEKIEYEYILKNIDNQWNELGTNNYVTFRNLPASKYTLEIRAHYAGSQIYSTTSLQIAVKPHWYNTISAKIGYVLIFIILISLIYGYYASKLKFSYTLALEKDKRLKEEELNDAKLTFFTNISHELRTPLTLLIAPLEQLISNETNTSKLNNLKIINKNANRLLSLVNQILDFRKSEKGKMSIKVKEIMLEEYIDNLTSSFTELAKEQNICFKTAINNPELRKIWIDPSVLDKICLNLLSNSFKFTPNGGSIEISMNITESELHISVSDTGKGISKGIQDKIFDRFFQENSGQPSFSYKTAGSGIGLHLVKTLTELHHGTISVKSEAGNGTEFIIILPCNKEEYNIEELDYVSETHNPILESKAEEPEAKESDKSLKPVIMLCDDNDEILDYLSSSLSGNYRILRCNDGETALNSIKMNSEIDLLICDIMMPGINGIEVCKQLKSNFDTSHIPIILLTAKSGMDDMLNGLECGADAYISKPFKISHLKAQIKQLLISRDTLKKKYQKKISFTAGGFETSQNEEEKFLHRLNKYILEHIGDSMLNGEILCNELSLSRSSLHRKLKAITGLSSGDYIRNLRLEKAAEMLSNSEMTISEICFMTGFNSPSYFTSCFKDYYKLSPKEYRTMMQSKKNTSKSVSESE